MVTSISFPKPFETDSLLRRVKNMNHKSKEEVRILWTSISVFERVKHRPLHVTADMENI
jgi:hypothetical protein